MTGRRGRGRSRRRRRSAVRLCRVCGSRAAPVPATATTRAGHRCGDLAVSGEGGVRAGATAAHRRRRRRRRRDPGRGLPAAQVTHELAAFESAHREVLFRRDPVTEAPARWRRAVWVPPGCGRRRSSMPVVSPCPTVPHNAVSNCRFRAQVPAVGDQRKYGGAAALFHQ